MYELINHHVEQLLNAISLNDDIHPYIWLLEHLHNTDVGRDLEFQRVYRHYWKLNYARLSSSYLATYFDHLEYLKHLRENDNVETVARHLLSIPTHSNGRQSLQFSFASKLVHMLHTEQPVYDNMVESFYFLPTGRTNNSIEQKITRLQSSYDFLHQEYGRVLEQGLLKDSITRFRECFQVNSEYTDIKIIDTLLWKFVGYLKSGAIRDGLVVYR